ncbi:MAG TPA: winged helix-turn-helix domain-containing protein [Acidobacteriaceae bacterium]|nr:winged helix-turn-helix domain-containing protein [Acidobacteriaceae bacterium]
MPIPGPTAPKYRFGPFELDPSEGYLFRNGNRVKLQKLPYRLLVMLVERSGEVVTREEVRQHLWPENTFVEFDNSLGVAIRKVRESLGDDAEVPHYIETIQGRGYRFIAPIRTDGPAALAPVIETLAPVPAQRAEHVNRSKVIWVATVIAGVLVIAGWFWWNRTHSRIPERASVVVGDFVNSTGDALFDGSLRRAVVIQLAQSPYLNIMPDGKLGEVLQDLGRSPDDKLTPPLALEVCQHGKASALITGSIQPTGGAYLLALEATRCSNESSLAHETITVANQESVLPRLGSMIDDLRRSLGESRASLQKFDVPLEQATTSSLEALKAYQLGLELRAHSKNFEARPAFKTAIALDPNFAIAYAQLGSSYSNEGEVQEGKKCFEKAFELRSRATEPERLYIVGRYFDIVTSELEKGSETYKLWTEMYPDEWLAYNALANDANLLGRYDTVVDASKQVVRLYPNHNFGYINLLFGLIALNRLDEAKSLCEELIGRGHDDTFIHLNLFAIASLRHDEQALSREYEWAQKHPDNIPMRYAQAKADAAMGEIKQSTELFEEAAKRSAARGDSEEAADMLATSAEINSEMGRTALAQKESGEAVTLGKSQIVLGLAALIASRAGAEKRFRELLDELDHDYPLSTFNMGLYSPMARTTLAVAHGRSAAEISNLMEPALPYELGQIADLLPIYVRGESYLKIGSGKEAEREFQKVVDHHGVDAMTTLYPLSQLGLARCYALQGRKADSRRAYEAFFSVWKDADRDLPILVKARNEYQELK